jgi:hypothetical protein
VSLRPPPPRRTLAGSPFAPPERIPTASEHVAVGDRVTHDRLGLGRVVRLVDDDKVVVDFGHEDGTVRAVSHVKLTKL